ncbi:MAG: GNAT family N-acetyltransferase [Bacteroidota bacterium]
MSPFTPLETSRLLLREVVIADAEAIFFLRSDPRVNAFVKRSQPQDLMAAKIFIAGIQDKQQAGKIAYWGIQEKNKNGLIGTICLWNFSSDRTVAELGYELHPEFQRQGIMGEALRCVMEYGRKNLRLDFIEAFTQFDNEASVRLLLRNGFVREENRTDADNPANLVFVSHLSDQN